MKPQGRRILVLGDTGVAVASEAVETVMLAIDQFDLSPWLPVLVDGPPPGDEETRRVLRVRGGGSFEVPEQMRMVEGVELLALPELFAESAATFGLVGLVELPDDDSVVLVCDPRRLPTHEAGPRERRAPDPDQVERARAGGGEP